MIALEKKNTEAKNLFSIVGGQSNPAPGTPKGAAREGGKEKTHWKKFFRYARVAKKGGAAKPPPPDTTLLA